MPSIRTNTLHITAPPVVTVHNGAHRVQITVSRAAKLEIARQIVGGIGRVDGSTIGIMRGAEVLLHPALVANLYSIIDVAVVVAHDGGILTGQTHHDRGSEADDRVGIDRAVFVGGESTEVVGGVG